MHCGREREKKSNGQICFLSDKKKKPISYKRREIVSSMKKEIVKGLGGEDELRGLASAVCVILQYNTVRQAYNFWVVVVRIVVVGVVEGYRRRVDTFIRNHRSRPFRCSREEEQVSLCLYWTSRSSRKEINTQEDGLELVVHGQDTGTSDTTENVGTSTLEE
jgi:hypothetical protein